MDTYTFVGSNLYGSNERLLHVDEDSQIINKY